MDVVGKNRTRVNHVVAFGSSEGKSFTDRGDLIVRKAHRRVLQSAFHGAAQLAIVRGVRDGRARVDFRRRSVSEEVPCPDEVGPRAAGVVGEPETVGAEDDVEAEEHGDSLYLIETPRKRGG